MQSQRVKVCDQAYFRTIVQPPFIDNQRKLA
jgi:hypothetical protein